MKTQKLGEYPVITVLTIVTVLALGIGGVYNRYKAQKAEESAAPLIAPLSFRDPAPNVPWQVICLKVGEWSPPIRVEKYQRFRAETIGAKVYEIILRDKNRPEKEIPIDGQLDTKGITEFQFKLIRAEPGTIYLRYKVF